jgi:hypothetical protein
MSHALTQLLVLVVQISLLLLFTFCVFNISSHGPFIWVVLLTMLQGTCGMAYGLTISAICKEENSSASTLALGSFWTTSCGSRSPFCLPLSSSSTSSSINIFLSVYIPIMYKASFMMIIVLFLSHFCLKK